MAAEEKAAAKAEKAEEKARADEAKAKKAEEKAKAAEEIAKKDEATLNKVKEDEAKNAAATSEPAPTPTPAPEPAPAPAPEPAPAPKPAPSKEPALGKVLGGEKGGQILPKEELNPAVLDLLKVCNLHEYIYFLNCIRMFSSSLTFLNIPVLIDEL